MRGVETQRSGVSLLIRRPTGPPRNKAADSPTSERQIKAGYQKAKPVAAFCRAHEQTSELPTIGRCGSSAIGRFETGAHWRPCPLTVCGSATVLFTEFSHDYWPPRPAGSREPGEIEDTRPWDRRTERSGLSCDKLSVGATSQLEGNGGG